MVWAGWVGLVGLWSLALWGCSEGDGALPGEMVMPIDGSGGLAQGPGGDGDGGAGGAASGGTSSTGGVSDTGDAGVPPGGDAPGMGTGPGDWGPGDYPPDLMAESYLEITGVSGQNGYARRYKVHVPPGYDPQTPTPLLLCIHGLGQTPVLFCLSGTGMHEKSDAEGFILVMPLGYSNSWNGGTCCGAASNERLDDVALMRAILEEVGTHVNVDLDRVYATGLSNGAYMSYRLACEATDMLAAIAPAAGVVGINEIGGGTNGLSDFERCEPSRPLPVLDVHGTADPLIAYSLNAPSMELLQQRIGCDARTTAATQPEGKGETTCDTYVGCPDGVELTACTVEGGGHCWFGSPDCGTGGGPIGTAFVGANSDSFPHTDAVWDFLSRFRRP